MVAEFKNVFEIYIYIDKEREEYKFLLELCDEHLKGKGDRERIIESELTHLKDNLEIALYPKVRIVKVGKPVAGDIYKEKIKYYHVDYNNVAFEKHDGSILVLSNLGDNQERSKEEWLSFFTK